MILTDSLPNPAQQAFAHSFAAYQAGDFEASARWGRETLVHSPNDPRALQLLGITYVLHLHQPEAGLALLQQAYAQVPFSGELNFNMSVCYEHLGQLELCEKHLWRAITDKSVTRAKENLAICLKAQNKIDICIAVYQSAQLDHPEHVGLLYEEAEMRLLNGDYERGWAMYEHRWALHAMGRPDYVDQFWKLGQDLQGKTILVFCDQGIGDTVMFLRYLPMLKALGATIQLGIRGTLIGLCEGMGVVTSYLLEDAPPDYVPPVLPEPDYKIAMGSLATAFKTELHTIPYAGGYFQAPQDRIQYWQTRLGSFKGKKIGIVWSGNPAQKTDYRRSMSFSQFVQALPMGDTGLHFFNLQKYPRESDKADLAASPVIDWMPEAADYGDTAALMMGLDLVISTCTSSVHVAGALGVPVWVLLSYSSDWRWLLDRTDSPWYNSAILIRQPKPNDWDSVLGDIKARLVSFANAPPLLPPPSTASSVPH